ncbi:MAG: PilZ domain-containing protein, partial [Deltaproteobacteria bacterium]|nr:PilZ domain-containing protein [Deltaproteobacteria bacterium]
RPPPPPVRPPPVTPLPGANPLPGTNPQPVVAPPALVAEQPSGVSRRKVARAAYATPVRIIGHHGVMEGRIEDISTRGVLVISAKALEIGVVVQMSFALPGNGVIVQTNAVLRWVRIAPASQRAALGFEFQVPPLALRNAVEIYVAQRESQSDINDIGPAR